MTWRLQSAQNSIQSVELVNLSESTTAMFPLVKPSLESLASQIVDSQSLDNLKYSTRPQVYVRIAFERH